MKHLSEKEIEQLTIEEPDINIRQYLELLEEISMIENSSNE